MALNLTAAQTLHLHEVIGQWKAAAHGTKAPVIERAAASLGVSPITVRRWINDHMRHDSGRKRRVDAGERGVTKEELLDISTALYGTFRKTGARIMTFDAAVEMLRANGVITTDLSAGRIATVLMEHGLHPSQMTRAEPAIEQRSRHPNHVWQVDASVCVAYYLSNATGLQVMDERKFYKNKPGNLTRVQEERLIRYAVADHHTHEVFTRYYLGSECAASLADFLIWCFAPKRDADGKDAHPMHGVPLILQMDMGSANTSAPVLNLCERLKTRVIIHERHNSRANGSVEKAHHLVEVNFESGLRFSRVTGLDDLNEKALRWANVFGARNVHSRYRDTRHNLWLTITAEQLRIAPPVALMRELVTTEPKSRRVSNNLEISFAVKGHGTLDYDVRYVPGVMAGAKVEVVVSPYRLPAIDVGYADAKTGERRWMTVEHIERGQDGWRVDGPVIGEEPRAAHRGLLERNRDEVLLRAYGAANDSRETQTRTERLEAAAKAQEAGALVFGGSVDPFKHAADAQLPTFMPKRGTALDAPARDVEVPRLNVFDACKRIREGLERMGLAEAYVPQQMYPWVQQRFGDYGMPEDQVDAVCAQLAQNCMQAPQDGSPMPLLRAVGGSAT